MAAMALGLSLGTARGACDAALPVPASLRSADIVADYAPTLKCAKARAASGWRSAE